MWSILSFTFRPLVNSPDVIRTIQSFNIGVWNPPGFFPVLCCTIFGTCKPCSKHTVTSVNKYIPLHKPVITRSKVRFTSSGPHWNAPTLRGTRYADSHRPTHTAKAKGYRNENSPQQESCSQNTTKLWSTRQEQRPNPCFIGALHENQTHTFIHTHSQAHSTPWLSAKRRMRLPSVRKRLLFSELNKCAFSDQ